MTYELHRDPRSSHQRIARFVRRLNRGPVLDVGASSGQIGRLLADSSLLLDGVEPDPQAAKEASPFYRDIQVATIEKADLPASTYPVVICADVLEHTANPVRVLRRLAETATPDATFLISLPNIGHLAARLIVLAGHFPQHERGIFDRTHLHFYTRKTAVRLVQAADLAVTHVATTPVPLEAIWPARLGSTSLETVMRAQSAAASLLPTLFAFQWLIVARRG